MATKTLCDYSPRAQREATSQMRWKSIASAVLSLISLCCQAIGSSAASAGMTAMAEGGQASHRLTSVSGAATLLAILLAVAATALAVISWPNESRSVRLFIACLSLAALVSSLIVV
jgi:hypothetical protein